MNDGLWLMSHTWVWLVSRNFCILIAYILTFIHAQFPCLFKPGATTALLVRTPRLRSCWLTMAKPFGKKFLVAAVKHTQTILLSYGGSIIAPHSTASKVICVRVPRAVIQCWSFHMTSTELTSCLKTKQAVWAISQLNMPGLYVFSLGFMIHGFSPDPVIFFSSVPPLRAELLMYVA